MKCPGCGNAHEEVAKNFIVLEGSDNWHRTCYDKDLRETGNY